MNERVIGGAELEFSEYKFNEEVKGKE